MPAEFDSNKEEILSEENIIKCPCCLIWLGLFPFISYGMQTFPCFFFFMFAAAGKN
jgi:hypothetical protein